jgi:GntR family transcriptional regulator
VAAKDAPGEAAKMYQRIATDLRVKIEAGEFTDDNGKLPSERELSKQHGVSADTARKALRSLAAERLIDIRPGSGAYVRTWKPILRDANGRLARDVWGGGKSIWSVDAGDRVVVPVRVDVAYQDAPADVRDILGAERVLARFRVYAVDGRPIQLATSYLPADITVGTRIEKRDTGPGGTYGRLAELGHEPTDFTEWVRARRPSTDEAGALHMGPGRFVLDIVRHARTAAGRVVEVNKMVLDADAYVLQYSFPA